MNREELLKNAKPILFSTEMVQAILEGRKTVTRRVIKPQPIAGIRKSVFVPSGIEDGHGREIKLLYKVGDILYIRETWRDRWGMAYANYGTGNAYPIDDVREIEYKTCGNGYFMRGCNLCPNEPTVVWDKWSKWKPSIHMPKEAARIFLKVNNVKVEKLQDMTQEDCIKEGCGELSEEQFAEFWNSLNAKRGYGWKVNPWVWVVEFERVEVENE